MPARSPARGCALAAFAYKIAMVNAPAHLISIAALSSEGVADLFASASEIRRLSRSAPPAFPGCSVGMYFPNGGFRTKGTFTTAIHTLGAYPIELTLHLDGREPFEDIAGAAEAWLQVLVVRYSKHEAIESLAQVSRIPIINAMSSWEHPCEVLSDALSLHTHFGTLSGKKICFVGAATNMCRGWFFLAAWLKIDLVHVCPEGEQIDPATFGFAQKHATGSVTTSHDLNSALQGADVVLTDTWPTDDPARQKELRRYQIDGNIMARTKDEAVLLPCPPVHRGEEVHAEVMSGAKFFGYKAKEWLRPMHQAILQQALRASL